MILSNVNIGTGPSAGDGDPLRSAFGIINNNFQIVTNNVNALTNSVSSVAGRTGNVVLTINDILGINLYATNSSVDSKIAANIANVGGGGGSNYSNSNVAAYLTVNNYTDKPYVAGQVAAANLAIVNANLGMKGYVDSVAGGTYSNVNTLAYLTTNSYATQAYINLANTSLKSYVDGQIIAANAGVTAANLGMKGYVDSVAGGNYSNVNTLAYLTTNSYATQLYVIEANSSLKVYTDGQVTAANTAVLNANIGMLGYVFQANATLKSYVDGQITAANAGVTSANLGMKGYVDSVASQSIYGNGNVKSYLTQFDGNILPSANVTYSLGSPTAQWKDLFVSNNTIYIGGTPLSVVNNQLTVGGNTISISWSALENKTGANGPATIALGRDAGTGTQGADSVAIGHEAGGSNQGPDAVAIGLQSGMTSQGSNASAFGYAAGKTSQGTYATAIGGNAGETTQGDYAVAIGTAAGNDTQGINSIAIGYGAGNDVQQPNAVAIGYNAGYTNQNANAIAIGSYSGYLNQNEKSIIINASGNILNSNTQGLYINPVRQDDSNLANVVYYNTLTKEMTYGAAAGSSYSNVQVATYLPTYTGNIQAGNVKSLYSYGFTSGAAKITNTPSSIALTPDTSADALAGVAIGGNGYLLGPNNSRNITLNYNGVGGAVGLQGNVTVGSAGSGNLFVGGNIIARDITAGNVSATGTSGKLGFNSGGFVQQATSNSTGVTSHTTSGNIQLMNLNLGTNIVHTVALTNNKLTTNDIIVVNHILGGTTSVTVGAYVVTDGLGLIWIRDATGGGTGNFTPMLKYAVIQAPSS